MRRSFGRRLAAATLAVGAMLPQAPAPATTVATDVFVGSMTLAGPLSYPLNPFAPGLPMVPQVPPSQHCGLPLPTPDPLPQCHFGFGGHTRSIGSFDSTVCTSAGANVDKVGKPVAEADVCSFQLGQPKGAEGHHLHGYCGLDSGQWRLIRRVRGQAVLFDLHVIRLFVIGHWTKTNGKTGLVVGWLFTMAMPAVTGTTVGNSCAASTATAFTVIGSWALLPA